VAHADEVVEVLPMAEVGLLTGNPDAIDRMASAAHHLRIGKAIAGDYTHIATHQFNKVKE
jgi:hypothetical protein